MSSETMIDRLVAELEPVRPRKAWRDALWLSLLALVEAAMVMIMMPPRHDLAVAVTGAMFWWKTGSCFALAIAGAIALVMLLDPAGNLRAARRWIVAAAVAAFVVAVVLYGVTTMPGTLWERLEWREGVGCLSAVFALGLPLALAIVIVARRAAPTLPHAAAVAAGVASAGGAALLFGWVCPHSDPLYVTVWYGSAIVLGAVLARFTLPPLLRW